MPFVPFVSRFYDLGLRELRSVTVTHHATLPRGQYGFLELYCNERDCDCRRVILHVLRADTGEKVWATINHGWESPEFYAEWMGNESGRDAAGPSLEPFGPQTEHSGALLGMFRWQLEEEAYVARLKQHYEMFRAAVDTPRRRRGRGGSASRFSVS
jgi:hypothetical protein